MKALLITWICTLSLLAPIADAKIGDIPVIGGVYNTSVILKQSIVKDIELTAVTTRDLSLYTIGGLTLDAYILTLPLEAKVKADVIKRLVDPVYAIGLGRFLYYFYNQYTKESNILSFNEYLKTIYSDDELIAFEHSLYQLKPSKTSDKADSKSQDNSLLIAALVQVYDIIFNNDDWQMDNTLPDQYTYLNKSNKDLKIIAKVQPILIKLMAKFVVDLEASDAKTMLLSIIADAKPENVNKVNNKAQAVTITLVDFIRLNVLKGYRQYALELQKIELYTDWMQATLADKPNDLIAFLEQQNNKRFAVQIAVDGLQQGLLNALVQNKGQDQANTFIKQVTSNINHSDKYKPANEPTIAPEHKQQLTYLNSIIAGKAKDEHYLPFFKSLYQNHRASVAQFGISSTPTISVRNLPIILTGADVAHEGGTGIPNFHFVDRESDRGYYFFGNDALQLDKLMAQNQVQTMFDRLDFLNTLNCNAQYDWNAQLGYDGLVNLAAGELIRDYGELRCLGELSQRAKVERKLVKQRAELIKLIKQYQDLSYWTPLTKISKKKLVNNKISELVMLSEQGMPDYVLMYIPWPDHFAHFKGPFSDEIIAPTGELNRLDYWLGQLQKVYKKAGVYQNTLWGMAGDHGLAQVFYSLNPEEQVLHALEKELGIEFNIEKISSDEGEGPKITNALNYPSFKDVDVVVASTAGGNYMMDFFNAKRGWKYQPNYQELKRWKAINQSSDTLPIDMIAQISSRLRETLDYLVVRESDCGISSCTIRIVGHRDNSRLDEIIIRKSDKIFYGLTAKQRLSNEHKKPQLLDLNKENPYVAPLNAEKRQLKNRLLTLCIENAEVSLPNTWCNSTQWRQLTSLTPRPDSLNQLAHIYDEDKAGTVNLFPKEGIGYNTIVPGRHAGEHYLEKDAFIGFWGAPTNNSKPIHSVANGSLAPTIYEYLADEEVVVHKNGWGFPSLLKQLQGSTTAEP